jgi:glycosyltransferase involved in cell wall biosynthesis
LQGVFTLVDTKSTPLVSVVIPFYNREKWLPISVNSVLQQTLSDWELILVDDRSTDDSLAVAEEFARADKRIRCVPNTHLQGPAGGRNQGVELARGRYVAFLDSDDEWLPHHLETMISYLERYPDRIDLMTANPINKNHFTGNEYEDKLDLSRWRYEQLEDVYLLDKEMFFSLALVSRTIYAQTLVAPRSLFDRIRFNEDIYCCEDCFMWLEIGYHRLNVGHIQKPHIIVWKHDDNTTNCNGLHSAERRLRPNLGIENYLQNILRRFTLTGSQKDHVNAQLADHCVWAIGYNCYRAMGDFESARRYIGKGIRLRPFKPVYWKVYLSTLVKQYLMRKSARFTTVSP